MTSLIAVQELYTLVRCYIFYPGCKKSIKQCLWIFNMYGKVS